MQRQTIRGDVAMHKHLTSKFLAAIAAVCVAAPVSADDSSAKTGLFAGLGFAAASGKSSLGDGAGSIEASLLVADPLVRAGRTIRQIVGTRDRDVLVITKGDTVDYSMAIWLIERIDEITSSKDNLERGTAACMKAPQVVEQQVVKSGGHAFAPGAGAGDGSDQGGTTTSKKLAFAPSDFAAALASETNIGQVKISFEDRQLVDAIMLGGTTGEWRDANGPVPASGLLTTNSGFRSLAMPAAPDPTTNGPIIGLKALQAWADKRRGCTGDEYKAMVGTVDTFVASATASDKGTPAIATAAEIAPKGFAGLPYILRVAIDDMGGTSVTSTNIWYSMGLPGAVQITSGLKVSFSLWDPKTGTNLVTGIVRCATRPVSYRDVRKMLIHRADTGEDSIGHLQNRLTTCAYQTT